MVITCEKKSSRLGVLAWGQAVESLPNKKGKKSQDFYPAIHFIH